MDKNENVVEETTNEVVEETTKQEQPKEETPEIDLDKFDSKDDPDVIKIDLDKPLNKKEKEKVVEKPKEEVKSDIKEEVVLEEITNEEEEVVEDKVEEVKEKVKEAIEEAEATGKPLPESIKKLMAFMEETGGDLEDYVKLNKDINKLNDNDILYEYYKQTKPHLNNEEINFLMEDSFSYDEEVDEERDVKRKKLALKEQVASARAHLDGQKSKYYEEIKAGSKLTQDQQKAVDFFNRYNKESEQTNKVVKRNSGIFEQKTNEFFGDKFKGFEYSVGDKKYRFNVRNKNEIKENQSDLNKFMSKFVDENSSLNDAKGYHKSLFIAMNADAVAQHFYEQGKADAIKDSVAKAKNVNMDPRQSHKEVNVGGVKYRVLGDDSSGFKFKIKNKK